MLKYGMHFCLYENRCKQGLSPCIAKCSMCNFLKMLKYWMHFSLYKNRYKQGLSPCIAKCSMWNFLKMLKYRMHFSLYKNRYKQGLSPCIAKCSMCNSHPPYPPDTHICTTHLPSSFARWKTRKGSDLPNQSFLSKLDALKCSVATSWKSWVV